MYPRLVVEDFSTYSKRRFEILIDADLRNRRLRSSDTVE